MRSRSLALAFAAALGAAAGAQPASAGDADRGKLAFGRCAACHALTPDAAGLPGPSLAGVIGRPAAQLPNFRYSPALKRSGLTWTEDTLDRFLANPQGVVRGNRMPFSGVGDAAERADLIAYLARDAAPAR
ncbi:c-type cytochrome [Methylopila sp. Yamaguchi]|uniref:c-type cytochrome n=1 Tax=Methylopila sp. Yamaguchi TaxID=1437817 RepID=UPI000CBFD137|nr:c-type cytochrome [Methylopila sp. Yamaguchi]GBD48742.1 cytochrome c [Methylopila sp. Yamaguchi]